jgi:hypothetical protein
MWKQYWPVYERLEKEFLELTFFISLEDVHLKVFSVKLADLLLRIGAENENSAKTLAHKLGHKNIQRSNFPSLGNILCSSISLETKSIEIMWIYQSLSAKTITPFSTWSKTKSINPVWYDAYNKLKHDRNSNFRAANYGNVLEGLAGLFILNLWLRKDEIERISEHIDFARRRIRSYSEIFNPNNFLQLGAGGTIKKLKLI